jgi:replicative DNA helicase
MESMTHSELEQLIQRVDATADGAPSLDTIATGFPTLDVMLGGGMRRGDLVVLGGDVASGKSSLALAIALRAAAARSEVAFYSGERSPERVLECALASEGGVTVDELRLGTLNEESRASVGAAALRLRDALPRVSSIPAGGVGVLSDELSAAPDLELAVVDGLASLPLGTASEAEALAASVRALKRAALECRMAILLTAPLPEFSAAREDPRPRLADFGALGVAAQIADVVLGIYREEMYQPGFGSEGGAELLVLKNRGGATGYLDLYFNARWLRFEDMLDADR